MTTYKNLKARVRERMERTGESYATARGHVMKESEPAKEGRRIPLPSGRRRSALTAAHGCAYGDYPWDHWCTRAKAAGVREELAQLGRSLMREADQHTWCRELWERCGWTAESAEGMIRFALEAPALADEQWSRLMETDGCIVEVEDDFRELTEGEFDAEYTRFALAFDRYFPADRIAGEEEDPFVQIPGAPTGMLAPRSQVEAMLARGDRFGVQKGVPIDGDSPANNGTDGSGRTVK